MRKGTVDIFPDPQFRLAHKFYGRDPHTPPKIQVRTPTSRRQPITYAFLSSSSKASSAMAV